ncbi:MAG: Binding-protein-dependent transport systems inner membrane component [Atribacteria bacterium 34_868]|nr:MAG: Binding-protein-dependent transport systems inner membrane component [Atribacteria bacterium 34_868]
MIAKQNRFLLSLPLHIFIILVALIWIFPTAGLLITSFRPASEVASSGWWTVFANPFDFTQFTLSNYKDVITNIGIGRAFVNTLIITIPATLIPILRIFNQLGLSGSFLGIWLAHAGYGLPLVIYLMYNFVSGLPSEIFESATIDGATTFQIFKSIVLPLSVPALASITIFQFIWVWNDLLVALVYLGGTPDVAPLTVRISALVGSYGQNWELLTAAAFVSMLLPLIIFLSLQRYFVRGILAGSIKG